jgi:hypothetical protein
MLGEDVHIISTMQEPRKTTCECIHYNATRIASQPETSATQPNYANNQAWTSMRKQTLRFNSEVKVIDDLCMEFEYKQFVQCR